MGEAGNVRGEWWGKWADMLGVPRIHRVHGVHGVHGIHSGQCHAKGRGRGLGSHDLVGARVRIRGRPKARSLIHYLFAAAHHSLCSIVP